MESDMRRMQNEKRPEISVIVPVYKVEKYLNECIDSILAQTFTDFELILVDDGSPDNCPAMCDAAAEKDDRIRVIHKPNGGVSSARNAGLDAMRGNWFCFIDSDDMVAADYLEALYQKTKEEHPDIVICDIVHVNEEGTPIPHEDVRILDEVVSQDEYIRKIVLEPLEVPFCKIFRSESFKGQRFLEGRIYEDALFAAQTADCVRKAVLVQKHLYYYRQRNGSTTHRKRTVRDLLQQVEANDAMFQRALEYGLTDVLCVYYHLVNRFYWINWCAITQEERKSEMAKQAKLIWQRDWKQLKQAHAITPRNVMMAAIHAMSQDWYVKVKAKSSK